jgi:apolipoprotein N-acyltransferase
MALVLMLLGGALHAASLAWPLAAQTLQFPMEGMVLGRPVAWLNVLALVLLARGLNASITPGQAALRVWVFASAMLVGSWWWLYISMHTYGGLHSILAALAVLTLACSVALIYALAGYVYGWLVLAPATSNAANLTASFAYRPLVFASVWLLTELTRGSLFTGFPWGASGYAHVEGILAKAAPLVGVYGMGALAAGVAGVFALVWTDKSLRLKPLAVGCGLLLAVMLAPAPQFTTSTGTLEATLLQGNIPQSEKFQANAGIPVALTWYHEQLLAATTPLVLAPETAIPIFPRQLPSGYLESLEAQYRPATGAALPSAKAGSVSMPLQRVALVGIPLGDAQGGYANSVMAIGKDYRYDKHHLVPFGEFVPPLFRWFTDLMNIPLGNFSESPSVQPALAFSGQRIAPNICYEDLFGEQIAPLFVNPQSAPTILANFSNIAWFGNTVAIDQHRNISRMRALEFQRPMLRATNTGATAIIDHQGRVAAELPRHTRAALVGIVEGRLGNTLYADMTASCGLLWWWLVAVALLLPAWVMRHLRHFSRQRWS